jgi:hypothetical protein
MCAWISVRHFSSDRSQARSHLSQKASTLHKKSSVTKSERWLNTKWHIRVFTIVKLSCRMNHTSYKLFLKWSTDNMSFEVSTVVMILMTFFWVWAPCGLGGRSQRFGEVYCLHLQGWSDYALGIKGLYRVAGREVWRKGPIRTEWGRDWSWANGETTSSHR